MLLVTHILQPSQKGGFSKLIQVESLKHLTNTYTHQLVLLLTALLYLLHALSLL